LSYAQVGRLGPELHRDELVGQFARGVWNIQVKLTHLGHDPWLTAGDLSFLKLFQVSSSYPWPVEL